VVVYLPREHSRLGRLLPTNFASRKSSAPGRFNITKQTKFNAPPAGTLADSNASEKKHKTTGQ
jgi:hypothetical protein